jgi:hypothetical protein
MNKSEILKSYFNLIDNGIVVDINSLPVEISKEVIQKITLYKKLKKLVAEGGNQEEIDAIKLELNPPQEEEING